MSTTPTTTRTTALQEFDATATARGWNVDDAPAGYEFAPYATRRYTRTVVADAPHTVDVVDAILVAFDARGAVHAGYVEYGAPEYTGVVVVSTSSVAHRDANKRSTVRSWFDRADAVRVRIDDAVRAPYDAAAAAYGWTRDERGGVANALYSRPGSGRGVRLDGGHTGHVERATLYVDGVQAETVAPVLTHGATLARVVEWFGAEFDGTCAACGARIMRTAPSFSWFHSTTGDESCSDGNDVAVPADADTVHPDDCAYCSAGESSVHNYEPPTDDEPAVLVQELPTTGAYASMRRGHPARRGHALDGVLVSLDGGALWHVVRSCCSDDAAEFFPTRTDDTDERNETDMSTTTDTAPDTAADTSEFVTPDAVYAALQYDSSYEDETAQFAYRLDDVDRVIVYRATVRRDELPYDPRADGSNGAVLVYSSHRLSDRDESGHEDYAPGARANVYGTPGDVWQHLSSRYEPGTAFECFRLFMRLHGATVGALHHEPYGGSWSVDIDDEHDDRRVRVQGARRAVYGRTRGIFEESHGHVDGVAYVPVYGPDATYPASEYAPTDTVVVDRDGGTSTVAQLRVRYLQGVVDEYSAYSSGNVFEYGVNVQTVTCAEFDDDAYEFVADDNVAYVGGYYGDDHRASGLVESVADAINWHVALSAADTRAYVSTARAADAARAADESADNDALATILETVAQLAHGNVCESVHYRSALARAYEWVSSPEFVARHYDYAYVLENYADDDESRMTWNRAPHE
jgi:hypothetical protein